jgi:SRSO17 transposase
VPFTWIAADTVYGIAEVEHVLRRAGKGYVLGVTGDHLFQSWNMPQPVAGSASAIVEALRPSDWRRLSAAPETKRPRRHDWAYLKLADLDAEEFDAENPGLWTRGLLIRRHIADGNLAFFATWCPVGTSIETLVPVEGHHWAIEDSFETTKNELGLDHNESRSWHGRYRHVSLLMLAFAMVAVIRHRQQPKHGLRNCRSATAADALVGPGNPSHRRRSRSETDQPRQHHRLVVPATYPSGRCQKATLNSIMQRKC